MKYYLCCIFVLFILSAWGQRICGIVTDEFGDALPYPTIRVKNYPIGTLGDSSGHFDLRSSRLRPIDTITVSYLGYNTKSLPVNSVVDGGDTLKVRLESMLLSLPEVKVSIPKKVKRHIKGNKNGRGWSRGYIDGETAGDSYGYEFHTKKNKILILDCVGLYYCSGDSQATNIKFRLNVYDMKQGKNNRTNQFKSVLAKPIYFEFTAPEGGEGRFEYILPEQIILPHNAIVEIEFVQNLGTRKFWYKNNVLAKRTWYREVDSDIWDRQPFATPFFVECIEMPAPKVPDPRYRPSALYP